MEVGQGRDCIRNVAAYLSIFSTVYPPVIQNFQCVFLVLLLYNIFCNYILKKGKTVFFYAYILIIKYQLFETDKKIKTHNTYL